MFLIGCELVILIMSNCMCLHIPGAVMLLFKDYWGRAWADYIMTIANYVAVPVLSQHC